MYGTFSIGIMYTNIPEYIYTKEQRHWIFLSFLLRVYFNDARATKKNFIDTLTKEWFKADTLRRLWVRWTISQHTRLFSKWGNEYCTVVSRNSTFYSHKVWRLNTELAKTVKTITDFHLLITTLHSGAPMKKDRSVPLALCQWRSLRKIGSKTACHHKSTVSKRLKKWCEKFWLQKFHRFQNESEVGNFQIENAYYFLKCDFLFNRYNAFFSDERTLKVKKSSKTGQRTQTIEFCDFTTQRSSDRFRWTDDAIWFAYSALRNKFFCMG